MSASQDLFQLHEECSFIEIVEKEYELLPFLFDKFINRSIIHQVYVTIRRVAVRHLKHNFLLLFPLVGANGKAVDVVLGIAHRVEYGVSQLKECAVRLDVNHAVEIVHLVAD